MTRRDASCHCGAVRLTCAGEPTKVPLCHCADCQRRTGGLFSVAAFFPRAAVPVTAGEARRFSRPAASGFDVTFHFCPTCGTNLWWQAARLPDLIGVAVGGFADPAFPPPDQAVWAQDQHSWLTLPAAIPSHRRNPVRGALAP